MNRRPRPLTAALRGGPLALVALFVAALALPASSQAVSNRDLLTDANIRIDGAIASDLSGISVAGAGDVDGDGRDDVIVGAIGADNNGRENSGSSYVIFGTAAQATIDLNALTLRQGFRIDGAAELDQLGVSVAGAGDVDGDGMDDVIIGANGADNNGRPSSGSSYVIYGAATTSAIDLSTLTPAQGFRIDGAVQSDGSGYAVAGAGDVDGDGKGDVIVGAPGADNNGRAASGSSYVLYGAATPSSIDLNVLTASQGFQVDGAAEFDGSGISVAGAGDVDGDGRDDVIVGARSAGNNGRTSSGSSYVIYGAATPSTIDLSALTLAQGFQIDGAVAGDQSGFSVDGAGDVDGDGRGDVIVGALAADNNGRSLSGSSYVLYGSASGTTIDLNSLSASQGFRIDGAAANDESGGSVAGAGDVNGDGRTDVLVGARFADNNGRVNSGSSYVIYGAATTSTIDLSALTPAQGFRIDGAAAGDQSGISIAGAGDVNSDGRDDVIAGAFTADNNGRVNSGSSHVLTSIADDPTAVDDSSTVIENDPATAIDVLANDTDPDGGPKRIVSASDGTNGSVAIAGNGARLTYAPAAGFCGADSFTYALNGGSSATVSVTVTCVDDPETPAPEVPDREVSDPALTADSPQKQRERKVRVKVTAAASELVTATATGTITVGKRKAISLKAEEARLEEPVGLVLSPARSNAIGRILRAIRTGKKVAAEVKVKFADLAGNQTTRTVTVRLR